MEHKARTQNEKLEVKTTTCYMCACRCGIRVHLRDGEVRYIDGNPDHPLNQGVICAKGSSGIMKQYSPARLTQPLMRKPDALRGTAQFEPVSWELAFDVLEKRLAHIRATDPKKFALFTGRDQMQALTGLFARQFGTPNYAAHGGFCSVNMAAGMIYTMGGSFWEFGGPDLDRAKLFFMIGTAEDHHSNPLKIAISKFKRAGGRFIAINPVRTGYAAIADEWVPIRPGTDGALFMALMRELIESNAYDREFVERYTNAGELLDIREDSDTQGLFVCDEDAQACNAMFPQNHLWWDPVSQREVLHHTPGVRPALEGRYALADGTPVAPSFVLLREQLADCTPDWASGITGIPVDTIRRLAREMADVSRDQKITLPIQWTDAWGETHETVTGAPIAFHAMRGLAGHSNGFQTIRALAVLMSLLGTIDRPGGFRHKSPYPRAVPPSAKPPNSPDDVKPNTPLANGPLGWPAGPEDLFIHDSGEPVRIDKAFSWEYPLAVHGLMHSVITNAWRGDPYPIDTLLIFMANLAWNSSMNTVEVRKMLVDRNEDGEYKIPFIVVCDAFQSEMTAFADLILPDTTYLERYDAMSMLDRPISEFDGPVDSVRVPVVPATGECKPFQEVLVELASRLKFPAFTTPDGKRKYRDYPEFIVNHQTAPGSGVGFLIGWRGKDGKDVLVGEPNPKQWEEYAKHNCVYHYTLPETLQYMRNCNGPYLDFAVEKGFRKFNTPIVIALYSDVMQKFRLAAQGKTKGRQPPEHLRARIARYFDPLPSWYPPLEHGTTDHARFPLAAITQRPMAMYHSWDSQNAWLRQIHGENYLYMNPRTAAAQGIEDGGWIYVESQWGKVRCIARYSEAVEPGTVWTWNAIGKSAGAWNLGPDANESQRGFLLNHLITDEIPVDDLRHVRTSNSDPVTGQAAWYDVRVRIYPAEADADHTLPQFAPMPASMPGMVGTESGGMIHRIVQTYFAGRGEFAARLKAVQRKTTQRN
ncbi:molybdopterin oxidoreductase family protein [Paraburkholderia hospita]|uniref:Formate dehydrogenase n=1 Tax=Paraburkholderia hospita TaxID=169430 RepID=A0AAN1JBQ1_9BURK|nr:molybdopterin oxidoreductase family protein [Paraburkholderia hospita]AUT70872.1 formate dehydrogenase [Paraburkholderia hospita]EIM93602.1 molybdopterin oxidoreductase [Paraburkholderia hospita]OUL71677.1 formate dehydrogenase [Paraburkholderia hospita]OUL93832.1 formate dehydrogenase [Paraburkholderia hospita]SEI25891.1 Molydopterin dinucleotide binding domain-containing protein [Paraburkholderia hospita]